ncbi:transposase [Salinispora fenicalii]|uniref:transposase n=1 Tax=Salinispora fenicalii TaxID=1137263 RepID=UPI000489DAF0|nr:transposase [Salinispora fenicalii]
MPLLDCDREVLYTTTISESLNARFRQAVRRRRHLPTEQAAMKVLHLVVGQRRKSGSITGRVYG